MFIIIFSYVLLHLVCATTKKAKACKNCSCGLAEELEAERLKDSPKPPPDTANAKSSCGSVSKMIKI